MNRKNIDFVFEWLEKNYFDSKTELNYSTNFQLLVAVMLSAQTTDKQVNKVTDKLFLKIREPKDVLELWFEKFRNAIKSIWLYNGKAKNIWATSNLLLDQDEKFGKYNSVKSLQELPWVWEKTAKVVAYVLFGEKVIAVDTHVHRVTNRLGIVDTKTPEQTSKIIERKVPDKYKDTAHHALVLFGRYKCIARKPLCEDCAFVEVCKYYKKTLKK